MHQIFNKETSIDVALLNMRSWKHGYDGDHTIYLSAILPAVFDEVARKSGEKQASKKLAFELLKQQISTFKEMVRSFTHTTAEKEAVI